MCGIVGYCGGEQALPYLLEGLLRLEYRGYDSAGVAVAGEKLVTLKAKGRIGNLKKLIESGLSEGGAAQGGLAQNLKGHTGIGHTRWATHGAPSDSNSHPHMSKSGKFAVVHNGIIENYLEIKAFLKDRSFPFVSETDTEVIGHLIDYYYRGDAVEAIIKAAQRLHGSYALAILCADFPDRIFAMRKDSPLAIGMCEKGLFLASDMSALLSYTRDFILPDAGEIAILSSQGVKVINFNREPVEKKLVHADWKEDAAQLKGFSHFMLKEIYEQPRAITATLSELTRRLDFRFKAENSNFNTQSLPAGQTGGQIARQNINGAVKNLSNPDINGITDNLNKILFNFNKSSVNLPQRIQIVACGSAYHAGLAAKYFIESLCRIPVECETASEYRYKNPIIPPNTLAVAISQSGETADTIAAINEAKRSAKVLSVVNVPGSTITRLSDEVIYTLAGPEIAVATTKGYICQVAALYKTGLALRRAQLSDSALKQQASNPFNQLSDSALLKRQLSELDSLEREFDGLAAAVEALLAQKEIFQQLSSRFSFISSAFFIGRGIDYAVAMEGALKLKEISYIHAQSYPAGELKHGTISLIEEGSLVVAVSTNPALYEKMVSNIREVQSRGAVVLAITCCDAVAEAADYAARIPAGLNSPFLAAVSLQLFAYYTALARGCDIDKPRNLAKSVTVE